MKNKKIFVSILIIVGVLTLISQLPFGDMYHDKAEVGQDSETENVLENTIEIMSYKYNPETITVKKGTTVTWINNDLAPHTVTIDDDSIGGPKSKLLNKEEEYSFTFNEVGNFPYHCDPHPFMKAEVVVVE